MLNLLHSVFSVITGIVSFVFTGENHQVFTTLDFFKFIEEKNASINISEVTIAILISVIIGVLLAFINNKKSLSKLAHKLNISKKFDELDVWSYAMNSDETYWLIIRDIEKDLLYQGWLDAYSSSHHDGEILLSNVSVFRNSNTKELL